jgi:hypothetical protein
VESSVGHRELDTGIGKRDPPIAVRPLRPRSPVFFMSLRHAVCGAAGVGIEMCVCNVYGLPARHDSLA